MKKSFFKDSSLAIIAHVLVYLKGIFLMPLIIKTVGVSVYGSYVLITAMVGIIYGISSLGVGIKSTRYLPSTETSEKKRKLFFPPFYFHLFSLVFISCILIIFQDTIKGYLVDDKSLFSIYIIPIYFLLYILYTYSYSYLRYTSRIFYMSLIGVGYAYLHIAFILVYFQYMGDIDINILFLSQGLVAFLVAVPVIILIYKELRFHYIFFKISEIKGNIKIGFPMVLNLIVDFVLASSDRFVLAYFMGVVSVGLYSPAYMLGSLILLIPKAIGTVVPQLMSKSIDRGEFLEAKQFFYNSVKVYIVIAIPFIFGIYLVSTEALLILANDEVAEKGQLIASIIAVGSFFYGLNILMSQANIVDLKTGSIFKANAFASIFNLIANIVILYFIQNIYVPAITTLLSFFLGSIYFYRSLDEKWLDSKIFNVMFKTMFNAGLMYILVLSLIMVFDNLSMLESIFIKVFSSLVIYFILVLVSGMYTMTQVKGFNKVFSK